MAEFGTFIAEGPSLLVLIVDVDYTAWETHANPPVVMGARSSPANGQLRIDFEQMIKSLIVFVSSFLLVHRQNKLAILAHSSVSSEIIYPTEQASHISSHGDPFTPPHHIVNGVVADGLLRAYYASSPTSSVSDEPVKVESVPSDSSSKKSVTVSGSLARALCSKPNSFFSFSRLVIFKSS